MTKNKVFVEGIRIWIGGRLIVIIKHNLKNSSRKKLYSRIKIWVKVQQEARNIGLEKILVQNYSIQHIRF